MEDKLSNAQLKLVTDKAPGKQEDLNWKEIRRDRLINSINRINFQDGEVIVNFRHPKYNIPISFPAKPQPCLDVFLECLWVNPTDYVKEINNFIFENIFYSDGLRRVFIESEIISIDRNGLKLNLPDTALEIKSRRVKRHKCKNVNAQLSQDGFVFDGTLTSFSAISFSVNIPHDVSSSCRNGINKNLPANIIFKNDNTYIYSGECEIFRKTETPAETIFILKPFKNNTQRFKSKKYRSIRLNLRPSPNIIFNHPFTGKKINLKVHDISGAGFSVEERYDNSLLLPGMIVSQLNIEFLNGLELTCKCQVIYSSPLDSRTAKCGFTFLDMDLKDQVSLSSLLDQTINKNCHVCTKINLDELWDFFFESGFVYPKKYLYIHNNRKRFEKVYKKLYASDLDIAINFIYQDKGFIYGHMSMFRFYDKTWIINHHAANSAKRSKAGLAVLEQIGRFINEFHRLPSTNMDYVACYYRPDNKFPNLVFGGAARRSSDGCTVDSFAYLHLNKKNLIDTLPKTWSLKKSNKNEVFELENFYEKESAGLTLKALDINKAKLCDDSKLNEEFASAGFKRDRQLYSLKDNNGELIAIFMVNVTELGMNMSDLTNCIHAFVLNTDKLPSKKMYSILARLSSHYDHDDISVLVFPKRYTDVYSVSYDKVYNFWVLNVEKSSDEYFDHVLRLIKRTR